MASPIPADAPPAGPVPTRILVVGGGGRENALGWALARCPGVEQVLVAPGNGGTAALAGCGQLAIAETDQEALAVACRERAIDLVVVGPGDDFRRRRTQLVEAHAATARN